MVDILEESKFVWLMGEARLKMVGGNMAGCRNGLQAHVQAAHPKMHFHWCDGHCLNLCLAKPCEKTKKVVDQVQAMSIAYDYSAKRQHFFREAVKDNQDNILGDKTKIAMLSETRWSARSYSFSDVKRGISH